MATNLSDLAPLAGTPPGAALVIAARDGVDPSQRRTQLLDPAAFAAELRQAALDGLPSTASINGAIGQAIGALGQAAHRDVGTAPGQVAAADDPRIAGALQAAVAAGTYAFKSELAQRYLHITTNDAEPGTDYQTVFDLPPGGTPGWNAPQFRFITTVHGSSSNDVTGIISILNSTASGLGQHVAHTVQTRRLAGGGNAALWGLVAEAHDDTGLPSDQGGPLAVMELDLHANGADPGNGQRVGMSLHIKKGIGTAPNEVANGFRVVSGDFAPDPTQGVVYHGFNCQAAFTQAAFDAAQGLSVNGAPAYRMAAGMQLWFDASGANAVSLTGGRITFTTAVAAPTAAPGTNSPQVATTAFVQDAIGALVGAAPALLNTLAEIDAQLTADEGGTAALAAVVGGKLAKAANLTDLPDTTAARAALGLGTAALLNAGTTAGTLADGGVVAGHTSALNAQATTIATLAPKAAPVFTGEPTIDGSAGGLGAILHLIGNGTTTPRKHIQIVNGQFVVVDSAFTRALMSLDDSGNLSVIGTASATTASPGTNTTQLATTAFVTAAVAAGGGGSGTVPVATVAASGAAQALAAPASGSKAYDITLTANCTLTLSGGTAGQQQTVTVYLRQDSTAGRVVTLPSGVKWPGGVAPTPNTAAGVIDVFTFTTPDAGTTWFGSY